MMGKVLPNAPDHNEIPELTQVDELETFIGKKPRFGCGQTVNKHIWYYRLGFGR